MKKKQFFIFFVLIMPFKYPVFTCYLNGKAGKHINVVEKLNTQGFSMRLIGDRERENDLLTQRQSFDRMKFWAVVIVAGLLLILLTFLISSVNRKANTNEQLKNLNIEVSRQKENLDRINHHLEEIIDERTKDLQIKNRKFSEYSSYLSHQIRGPIATLKGLMNLEKEALINQSECIEMMNRCVSEIDEKIIEMNNMLHDKGKTSL